MHQTALATRLFVEHKSETAELAAVRQAVNKLTTVSVVWASFPTMQSGEGTYVITAQVFDQITQPSVPVAHSQRGVWCVWGWGVGLGALFQKYVMPLGFCQSRHVGS